VVWSQSLILRSPVDSLQFLHPDLATGLRTVSNQFLLANSDGLTLQQTGAGSSAIENRLRLLREFNGLLDQIRTPSGSKEFFQPKKGEVFSRTVCHGPVVVINCHEQHYAALIILTDHTDITHIPLPNVTVNKALSAQHEMRSSLQRKHIRERGV
jgi:hypothetical protein